MSIVISGRPDGLGNRIEELIVLEAYCLRENCKATYIWKNKPHYFNGQLIPRSYDIYLSLDKVDIIADVEIKDEVVDFNQIKEGFTQLDFLNVAKNITPNFNIHFENGVIQMTVSTPNQQVDMQVDLVGRFNVYNVLAVLATLLESDVAFDDAVEAIKQLSPLNGRMQQFGGGNLPLVIVDYAHTPDSLENVLQALKEETKQALICVFGCGGNRDSGKRALMGKVASAHADSVIVTTDNPRHERAEDIIQAILKGIVGDCIVEADRGKAIALAIGNAKVNDVVLIAGKGHEAYQEIAGEKYPFSDVEQVKLALQAYQEATV